MNLKVPLWANSEISFQEVVLKLTSVTIPLQPLLSGLVGHHHLESCKISLDPRSKQHLYLTRFYEIQDLMGFGSCHLGCHKFLQDPRWQHRGGGTGRRGDWEHPVAPLRVCQVLQCTLWDLTSALHLHLLFWKASASTLMMHLLSSLVWPLEFCFGFNISVVVLIKAPYSVVTATVKTHMIICSCALFAYNSCTVDTVGTKLHIQAVFQSQLIVFLLLFPLFLMGN